MPHSKALPNAVAIGAIYGAAAGSVYLDLLFLLLILRGEPGYPAAEWFPIILVGA